MIPLGLALVALVMGGTAGYFWAFTGARAAPNGPDMSIATTTTTVAQGATFQVNLNIGGTGFDPYSGFQGLLTFDPTVVTAQSATNASIPNKFDAPTLIDNTAPGGSIQVGLVLLGTTTTFAGTASTITFQAGNVNGCAVIDLVPHTGAASDANGSFTIDPSDNVSAQVNTYSVTRLQVLIGTGTVGDCGGAATATPTSSATATSTRTPTATNTAAPTATNTVVATATNTAAPTATNTAAPTATNTVVATATNTAAPTATNTAAPTATNTVVATATNTAIATATNTAAPTATNTVPPTATGTTQATSTSTSVPTSTNTAVPTSTAVATSTNTATPTLTAVATNTSVPASTNTATPTLTPLPTNTAVATSTNTARPTSTNTAAPTATRTNTPHATATRTATVEPQGCMTLGEKISALVNILLRFGSEEGERRYRAKYDVNHDGEIDLDDAVQVLEAPRCRPKHGR